MDMSILKHIGIILVTILTSFYFFPFEFTFLPGMNTKMIMAAVGLVFIILDLSKKRDSMVDKDFFILALYAAVVSLTGFISVVVNDTNDYAYSTYIISMLVWSSAAYVVISCIKILHGTLSIDHICNYLIAVCALQCIIAYSMEQIPALKIFVDSFLAGEGFMGKSESRLYGIGASLDVAGTRFAAVSIMIASMLVKISGTSRRKYIWLYMLAFIIISIIGNMISRTTGIGIIMALCYMIFCSFSKSDKMQNNMKFVWKWMLTSIIIIIPITIILYNTNHSFNKNIRFAFEGFFSLVEEGKWEIHSNNILQNMYVFPDNTKTWIIGDGYFGNPYVDDPTYVGKKWYGFYQDTDVGYCRFIFYFGLIGLFAFMSFMGKVGFICIKHHPKYKILFILILLLNFIIWMKVSTDIFLVFALFLAMGSEGSQVEELEEKTA